jgi:hypothetical protein
MCRSKIFPSALVALISCLLLLLSPLAQTSTEMPTIEGETLAGHTIKLPDAASGKVTVLVLGFSKASKTQTSVWGKRISDDFSSQPLFVLYQLPVLEDVPRLIRGMVISGIRKGVPENMRDHFVPVLHDEDKLKTLVGYKEPDDAYVVVLDRTGKLAEQAHGPLNDVNYSQFRMKIESLLNAGR